MALFPGEELIDVTTPDGRAMKLPRSIAAAFPGLATPPPVATPPIAPPMPEPVTREAGAVPSTLSPPASAAAAPMPQVDTVSAADPVTPAPPAPRPAPAPVQEAPRINDRDLAKMGATGALNEQYAALGDAAAAGRDLADVQAKESLAIANAYHERNEELDKMAQARAKEAEDWTKRVDQTTTEYQTAAKAYADHKVDRSVSHPILAAISVALGGLGSAMKNEGKNPALDMLMAQIDKSVQLQMAERDKLRDVAGGKRSAIDLIRAQAGDATARYNLAMAGATEKAARQVEELKMRSNSDRVKVDADALAADLRLKGAGFLDGAVARKLQLDQEDANRRQRETESRRQAGIAYARLKQDAQQFDARSKEDSRQFDARLGFDREKLEADKQAALAAAQAKGGSEAAKQMFEFQKLNEERGVSDVATGSRLLQPEGVAMLKQAESAEAQAKKLREAAAAEQDPAKREAAERTAAMQEQRASELRGEAEIRHTWRLGNADQAAKVGETISNTQSSLALIDKIDALERKHGANWTATSEGEQAMQSYGALLELTVKDAYQLGALDKGSEAYLKKVTGGDPAKITLGHITTMLGSAKGSGARRKALGDALETRARNTVRTRGYRGDIDFHRATEPKETEVDKAYAAIQKDKTPLEQGAGGQGSWLRRNVIDAPGDALRAGKSAATGDEYQSANEKRKSGAEETGTVYGLSDEQQAGVNALIAQARGAGPEAQQARERLLTATRDGRASLSTGVIRTLRDSAPEIYQQAVQGLAPERRAFYERLDSGAANPANPALAGQSVGALRSLARGGATNLTAGSARQELFRRASAGDPDARAAIADLAAGGR